MQDKNVSLTDEIYQELVDGLKTGLDWPHFLAEHKDSKGPTYNAIGQFLNDMGPKVKALGEVQAKLGQAGLTLDSLDQKIKEAESSLAPLEGRRNVLNEQIEALEVKLAEKSELASHLAELSQEAESLSSEVGELKRVKERLNEDVKIQTTRLRELRETLTETERERSQLNKETGELRREKAKLSSEVDGRMESLRRLNEIGFADEDLLRLKALLEKMGEKEGIKANQLKIRFFSALNLFADVLELERKREAEAESVKELSKTKSLLTGEVAELETRKAVLQSETEKSASLSSKMIKNAGQEAVAQIKEEGYNIRTQLTGTFEDILRTGEAVGEMRAMLKKGEESEKSLESFIQEIRSKLRRP